MMPEGQWSLVQTVDKSMLYQVGEGYLDLGLDNVFDFDSDGNLIPNDENSWLALNGNTVAYYHTETLEKGNDEYSITGYPSGTFSKAGATVTYTYNIDQSKIGSVTVKYQDMSGTSISSDDTYTEYKT